MEMITQEVFGGPEVLRLVRAPDPVPGPGEVLIEVAAAGVNPVDAMVRAGLAPILGPPPFTLGWDVAGRVIGGAGFAPGTRVFGLARFPAAAGAYATRVAVPATELAATPAALSDAEVGALPLAGLTAWQALTEHGRVAEGARVLIHAAGGGVGHLAVQIAAARGAEVTAVASAGKHAALRDLGAARVLAPGEDPAAGFDMVLSAQGGAQAGDAVARMAPGGRIVSLLEAPEAAAAATAAGLFFTRMVVHPDGAGLRALAELAGVGRLKVLIAREFPLAEAGAAQAFLAEARPMGKVVLRP